MLYIICGLIMLVLILHGIRDESADPFWFCGLSNIFDVTRHRRPVIYWIVIASEILFTFGVIAYGIFRLI